MVWLIGWKLLLFGICVLLILMVICFGVMVFLLLVCFIVSIIL